MIGWILVGKIEIVQVIKHKSALYDVDWRLTFAIAWQESRLDPNAEGDQGRSIGIMQILDTTAEMIEGRPVTAQELKRPEYNIELGVRYIKYQMGRYPEDLRKVVSAYNAGSYRSINREYVNRVMAVYDAIANIVA